MRAYSTKEPRGSARAPETAMNPTQIVTDGSSEATTDSLRVGPRLVVSVLDGSIGH